MIPSPGADPILHEIFARRIVQAWGYEWVTYEEWEQANTVPGTPEFEKFSQLDSIRRNAEDAALAIIRQLDPNPGPGELWRRGKIQKAMNAKVG